MNKYVRRLYYLDEEQRPYNPLMHIFFMVSLAYGVGFVFFGSQAWVQSSSLYTAMSAMNPALPQIWGLAAFLTMASVIATLMFRIAWLGINAALIGFMMWAFAFLVYLLGGDYLIMISVTLPQAIFWVWYYIQSHKYIIALSKERRIPPKDST